MVYLTRSSISLEALLAEASSPECGGTCVFLGTVRNGPEEKDVTAIEYSAYQEMVEGELGRIVAGRGGAGLAGRPRAPTPPARTPPRRRASRNLPGRPPPCLPVRAARVAP